MGVTPRRFLVTGGTGALGTAVTRRLLEEGHRVAASWIVPDEADRLRHDLAEFADLFLVRADVSKPGDVATMLAEAEDAVGGLDGLVHLVGMWRGGVPLQEVADEAWDLVMDVNLRTAFNCARAVLPGMLERGWGRLVFVSSRTTSHGQSGQVPYAVAKAGVAALAAAIADETRGTGITSNSVSPSILDTEANRRAFPDADQGRWVGPADLAATISFLVSDAGGAITAADLPVHGGIGD